MSKTFEYQKCSYIVNTQIDKFITMGNRISKEVFEVYHVERDLDATLPSYVSYLKNEIVYSFFCFRCFFYISFVDYKRLQKLLQKLFPSIIKLYTLPQNILSKEKSKISQFINVRFMVQNQFQGKLKLWPFRAPIQATNNLTLSNDLYPQTKV